MPELFSLDTLIATATIALIVIGIPMVLVLIRILIILNAIGKIVSTVAEESVRVKKLIARFFPKSKKDT